MHNKKLTTKDLINFLREISLFGVTVSNSGLRTVETIYLTRILSELGVSYQASAGMINGMRLLIESLLRTPTIATSIVTAGMEGGGETRAETQQALRNGQLIGVGCIALTGIGSIFMKDILNLLRQPKEQVDLAASYFLPGYIAAQPAIMMTNFNEQYLFSLKGWHFLSALMIQILSTGIYAASPWFDKQDMRVRSLGIGTAGQYWTNYILLEMYMAVMFGKKTLVSQFRFNKKHLALILKIGIPILFQFVAELFTVDADSMLAGFFGGVSGAERYSAAMAFISLLVVPTLGFANAARLLVSRSMGANNYLAARLWGWGSILAGTAISSAIAAGFYFGRDSLAEVFLPKDAIEKDVVSTGWLVFVVACINIPDIVRNVSTQLVITLGNILYPTVANPAALFVGILSSGILGYFGREINGNFFNAAMGVLLGQGIGLTLGNITSLAWLRQSHSNEAIKQTKEPGYCLGFFANKQKKPRVTFEDVASDTKINEHADETKKLVLDTDNKEKQRWCGIM